MCSCSTAEAAARGSFSFIVCICVAPPQRSCLPCARPMQPPQRLEPHVFLRAHTRVLRNNGNPLTPRALAYAESRTSLRRSGSAASFSMAPRASLAAPRQQRAPIHSYTMFEPYRPSHHPCSFQMAKLARVPNNTPPAPVIATLDNPAITVCPRNYYAERDRSSFPLAIQRPHSAFGVRDTRGQHYTNSKRPPVRSRSVTTLRGRSFAGGGTIKVHKKDWSSLPGMAASAKPKEGVLDGSEEAPPPASLH